MKALFLRLYLILFLSLVLSAIGLDFLYAQSRQREPAIDATQWLWQAQHPDNAATHSDTTPAAVANNATAATGHWLPIEALHWPATLQQQLQQQRSLQWQDADGTPYFYGLSSDNQRVYVLAMPPPVNEDRHWYWLIAYYATLALVVFLWLRPLVRDIDKLRTAVQALELPTTELAIPVHQRSALTPVAHALRDLRQHTVELMALQRDIADAVSHDIRTPLARIRFALAMLPASADPQLSDGIQADLREIDQLIDELLRYAEFEHRVPVLQKQLVPLREFVDAVVQRYRHHQAIQITVDIDATATLLFDRNCLQRLLQNLLDNALRYARSQIVIRWQQQAGDVLLSVEDDGPGLSLPDPQEASAAFVADSERGGFGLGLAIVKKIALWHGAQLQLTRSSLFGGARVMVRLAKG